MDADSGCLSRPPLLVRLPGRLLVRGSGGPGLHLRGLRHGPGPGEVHGDDGDDMMIWLQEARDVADHDSCLYKGLNEDWHVHRPAPTGALDFGKGEVIKFLLQFHLKLF